MKFSLAAVLAAASAVVAQLPPTAGFDAITHPTDGQVLTSGDSFDIVWEPNGVKGTITIHLIQGAAANLLQDGGVVAANVNNLDGTYKWTVPAAQYAAYGFNITSDDDPSKYQLSFGFHIKGGSGSQSYPVGSATATASASGTGYPTSKPSYTSTITLSQGPSYSYFQTSTSAPVSTYVPTSYPAPNSTYVAPTSSPAGTGYPTTPVVPSSSAPSSAPSAPVQPGSGARFGASGLAAVAGLVFALAM